MISCDRMVSCDPNPSTYTVRKMRTAGGTVYNLVDKPTLAEVLAADLLIGLKKVQK